MSMERIVMVAIEVSDVEGKTNDARPTLEQIENEVFNDADALLTYLLGEGIKSMYVSVIELTDFVDLCNNNELDTSEVFMGYVQIKN